MRPVGRPKADTESLTLRLPRDLIAQIDELRRIEADLPNRQEMIRRILIGYVETRRADVPE
ncbi:ribbon-helix-helix protein, CopG family [Paracoccaceae bacterium Fryx2]|nr:ribbon-helix-helix protein, CopG family [Paracoccaceae bacterium Fryx2]